MNKRGALLPSFFTFILFRKKNFKKFSKTY